MYLHSDTTVLWRVSLALKTLWMLVCIWQDAPVPVARPCCVSPWETYLICQLKQVSVWRASLLPGDRLKSTHLEHTHTISHPHPNYHHCTLPLLASLTASPPIAQARDLSHSLSCTYAHTLNHIDTHTLSHWCYLLSQSGLLMVEECGKAWWAPDLHSQMQTLWYTE